MSTSISTKFAALGLALMINTMIMGGMAYLFYLQQPTTAVAVATIASPAAGESV
jgi:hypothetical protein